MNRCPMLIAAVLIAALLPTAAPAHYIDLRGKLVTDATLTFGLSPTGRPFAYRQDGAVRGAEVDIAEAVAHSRGLSLVLVTMPRDRLLAALAAGEVDLINTLALKGETPDGVVMLPYLVMGDHAMVLKGNPFRIRRIADLAGHTVSATAGSTAEAFALEINERFLAEGRGAMHVHSFPNQRHTHFPVSMGHAPAYFVQTVSAVAPTLDPDSRVRLVEGAFRPVREVGFGIREDNPDLLDAVQHALAAKVAAGIYDRILERHGLPADLSAFR